MTWPEPSCMGMTGRCNLNEGYGDKKQHLKAVFLKQKSYHATCLFEKKKEIIKEFYGSPLSIG